MKWTRYSVWIRLELYVPHYNYQWIFLNKIIIKSQKIIKHEISKIS